MLTIIAALYLSCDTLVENAVLDFKQWRGVATRYAKNRITLPSWLSVKLEQW